MIHATLRIDIDAFDSNQNDADADITETVLSALSTRFSNVNVIERSEELLLVTATLG